MCAGMCGQRIFADSFSYFTSVKHMNELKPIEIKPMNPQRFQAYIMFTRRPFIQFIAEELEYYSNEDESLLGLVLLDRIDGDFVFQILARDEVNHYRTFEVETSVDSIAEARDKLIARMKWLTQQNVKKVEQGGTEKGVNLFEDQIPETKQSPYYKLLKNHIGQLAAKQLLLEIEKFYMDIDGNFIEQFQSLNGFDSRLWEIYLFCFFTEELFEMNRTHDRPDYIIAKGETEIAVEAVIVGRKKEPKPFLEKAQKTKEETRNENMNDMPLRFSSALDSKLKKEYWKLPQVSGKPLIIAIVDFHEDFSNTWSFSALLELLYGYKHSFYYDSEGRLVINPIKVEEYIKPSGSKVPSGFFFQPNAEHISAVLSSSTATLSKFNRIGKQSGFGSDKSILIRQGAYHNHDPNASMPLPFSYTVDTNCFETWSEGTSIYHNPRALQPVNPKLFPSVAHHRFDDGQIISDIPEFHPYFSITRNIIIED
jgi:hypothetical protein